MSLAVERGHVVGVEERRHRIDQLVVHLLVIRVELDRALVLIDGAPELSPSVAEEQVAVIAQEHRIGRQRLCDANPLHLTTRHHPDRQPAQMLPVDVVQGTLHGNAFGRPRTGPQGKVVKTAPEKHRAKGHGNWACWDGHELDQLSAAAASGPVAMIR